MRIDRTVPLIVFLLLAGLILSACQPEPAPATPTATAPAPTLAPTATPTPVPVRELVVCLGQEPNTLYPYGNPSSAARSVMAALFDGPIDSVAYEYLPVILESVPSLDSGDAFLESLQVFPGDLVVNTSGELVVLEAGVQIYPSDCRSSDCALTYDGGSSLAMDQLVVQFTLLPTVFWSDGTPLTAQDSVFSFNIAADPATPVSKYLIDRTLSYEALDDATVEWRGLPGFMDPTYFINFWTPLPSHLLADIPVADLAASPLASQSPVGWGPFLLEEWQAGDHLTLARNPNYFLASEGLPRLDRLTFRFVDDPNEAISALLEGQCDLLDPSTHIEAQASLLLELDRSDQILAGLSPTMILERIDFGIRPASYDDGYVPGPNDRPDLLGEPRTRQAIAMCMDRQQVIDRVLYGLVPVPDSFLPPDHPLFNPDVQQYPYDPSAANLLLGQVGWEDHDSDPGTPRLARGVFGIPDGTPLVLNYTTTSATLRRQVSEILAASLQQCGVSVNLQHLPAADFYKEGPDGLLFGRKFDLAQYAISFAPAPFAHLANMEPSCAWFTSVEMPADTNRWVGTNVSGFSSREYDLACQTAIQALPEESQYLSGYRSTQLIFARELPSLPLYYRLKAAASRPDLCGFEVDPVSVMDLWNVENFDFGAGCQP